MTRASYAELTWPQIADLARDVPLAIPLGLGAYDLSRVKGTAPVVLPAVPYGFPRPGEDRLAALAVRRGLFGRVLRGIQRELLKQGFTRVLFLDAYGVARWLGDDGMEFVRASASPPPAEPWPPDLARRVVVVSTGHTEQHGHHLPVGTDTVIAEAIASGVAAAAPADVACLPCWPYGVSTHTRQFPATLDLGGRVFEDFFLAIVGRLIAQGARMVLFSNAHGGNHSYLVNVVKGAGERWPEAFVATEFLHTTGPALERHRQSSRGGMGHGGELETSYLLHLRPDLVDMTRATVETDFISTPNYYMDWIEGGRLIANPPWTDDTRSGIYGDATLASAEKGRLWLEAAVGEKLEAIAEIREQHARRAERRRACWPGRGGESAS